MITRDKRENRLKQNPRNESNIPRMIPVQFFFD